MGTCKLPQNANSVIQGRQCAVRAPGATLALADGSWATMFRSLSLGQCVKRGTVANLHYGSFAQQLHIAPRMHCPIGGSIKYGVSRRKYPGRNRKRSQKAFIIMRARQIWLTSA